MDNYRTVAKQDRGKYGFNAERSRYERSRNAPVGKRTGTPPKHSNPKRIPN